MNTYKQGDRVNTPHGLGTVQGFESFNHNKGTSLPPSDTDNGGRVLVKLDNPSNWPASTITDSPPHYWRNEIQTAK